MTKQVYRVIREDSKINILRNETVIYSIIVAEKSINLMQLYTSMDIDIHNDIVLESSLRIGEPQDDADRIYNNTIDFIERLLKSINLKLQHLRAYEKESVFN